jgi:hypothetical protein
MRTKIFLLLAILSVASLTLYACGGGGGGGTTATGTVASKGTITALGSIFVNGVEYQITGAKKTDNKGTDSVDLSESAFKPGMVVNIKGNITDDAHHKGEATEVELEDNLEGPVDITPTNGIAQFQALGQTVALNITAADIASGKTRLSGFGNFSTAAQIVPTLATALPAGSRVEVSGLTDANGVIQATFINKENGPPLLAADKLEVKGTIAGLDTTAKTFTINALTVDYSSASLHDISAGGLANGIFVEVKGTGAGYTLVGSSPRLVATKIESNQENAKGIEGAKLEVEGFVSGFTGANTFKVSGQPINAGSLSLAGLADRKKVEVEGTLTNGVLFASKITIKP